MYYVQATVCFVVFLQLVTLVNSYVTMKRVSLMITDVMVMISVEITVMRVDVVSGSITLPCMLSMVVCVSNFLANYG